MITDKKQNDRIEIKQGKSAENDKKLETNMTKHVSSLNVLYKMLCSTEIDSWEWKNSELDISVGIYWSILCAFIKTAYKTNTVLLQTA